MQISDLYRKAHTELENVPVEYKRIVRVFAVLLISANVAAAIALLSQILSPAVNGDLKSNVVGDSEERSASEQPIDKDVPPLSASIDTSISWVGMSYSSKWRFVSAKMDASKLPLGDGRFEACRNEITDCINAFYRNPTSETAAVRPSALVGVCQASIGVC